jgi:hypothetical protein
MSHLFDETVELLHAIAEGKLLAKERTDGSAHQNRIFELPDGTVLVIFDDAGSMDYIDSVAFSPGQTADFDDWWDSHPEHSNPLDLLSHKEAVALALALKW